MSHTPLCMGEGSEERERKAVGIVIGTETSGEFYVGKDHGEC